VCKCLSTDAYVCMYGMLALAVRKCCVSAVFLNQPHERH